MAKDMLNYYILRFADARSEEKSIPTRYILIEAEERGCFVTLLKSRSNWNFLDIVNTWIEALCY